VINLGSIETNVFNYIWKSPGFRSNKITRLTNSYPFEIWVYIDTN